MKQTKRKYFVKGLTFRKIMGTLHLWLGLASGLVVFIVGITGCCYVFIDEITHFTQPWQLVKQEHKAYLLPSRIKSIVEKKMPGKEVTYLNYEPGHTSYVPVFGKDFNYGVYVNPYNGTIQHIRNFKEHHFDFFGFVLDGHINLWLPYKIGQPIEHAGILIFVILLVSGLVLWWPKNLKKANVDKSFKIKWKAKFKRINYDLHNVLGFYVLLIAFAIAVTGLVWSYGWVSKSLYWMTSGGKSYPDYKGAQSDTTGIGNYTMTTVDSLWLLHTHNDESLASSASFPKDKKDVIAIVVNPVPGTGYKCDRWYYDRYTLQPVKEKGAYAEMYAGAPIADKIVRMNYDIHTGKIGGLLTKIVAFFASLICASLPVTGFYIWWGKKKKKMKGKRKRPEPSLIQTSKTGKAYLHETDI